ncbi:hypothetical protein ACLMJK_009150 [Lecanora helva]
MGVAGYYKMWGSKWMFISDSSKHARSAHPLDSSFDNSSLQRIIMHLSQSFQVTTLLTLFISSTNGLPPSSPLQSRQTNCGNAPTTFTSSCWSSLNLGDFLTNPTTGWNSTTGSGRPCVSGDNAAFCCRNGQETWSSCFLRQSLQLSNSNYQCGATNSGACPSGSYDITNGEVPTNVHTKHQYVMRNIYAIFQLFTAWQNALPRALNDVGPNMAALISENDPQQHTTVNQSAVFHSFLLGFPFIALPVTANLVTPQLNMMTKHSAQALQQGLQRAPNIAQSLFSNNTASTSFKLSGVQPYLTQSTTIAQLNATINNALAMIMSDIHTFVDFAGSGSFSVDGTFGIDGDDQGLDVGVETFATTEATGNGRFEGMVGAMGMRL